MFLMHFRFFFADQKFRIHFNAAVLVLLILTFCQFYCKFVKFAIRLQNPLPIYFFTNFFKIHLNHHQLWHFTYSILKDIKAIHTSRFLSYGPSNLKNVWLNNARLLLCSLELPFFLYKS